MTHISISLVQEEYDSFLRAIPNDKRLPASYYDWIKNRLQEDSNRSAQGRMVEKVVVQYEVFSRYCRTTG